jgi:catechol 2,3-dioxygenase-like lactoylglutathione lyase family enzyme
LTIQVLGFHHLAIGVRDLAKVGAFYRQVLGLAELKRHFEENGQLRSIWFSVPGGGFVALEQREDAAPGNNFSGVCAPDLGGRALAGDRRVGAAAPISDASNPVDDLFPGPRGEPARA